VADRTLQHLLIVYAAIVAAMHQLVGMEVAAFFLQELVMRLEAHYQRVSAAMEAISEEGTVDKECNNLVLMVGFLLHFQVIDATLAFDLARKFSTSLSALNVELLLTLLQCQLHGVAWSFILFYLFIIVIVVFAGCGPKMRAIDPLALKDVTATISQQAVAADGATIKPRVRFMLDVITDLKHNRNKLVQENVEEAATLLKVSIVFFSCSF
jgi:nucleolar MIF4G domain-containing protein 1